MKADMNIINAACVYPEGFRACCIEIRDGVITAIHDKSSELSSCDQVVDAKDYLVMPGMIDSHVHIRGGDFSYREDFYSGSVAAAASGITTILEMPGCAKPASTLEHFLLRVEEVGREGALNFGLYGGAGGDNLEEIPKLRKAGAIGYKTFQMAPVAGREKEFYGLCTRTYEDMVRVMKAVKETGLTLTVHCESQDIIDRLTPEILKKDPLSLRGFIASRPVEAELESVKLTIRAAGQTGCRTIIAHVSAPETMELILKARKEGMEMYSETCAHYLCFDREQMLPYHVFARMKPPFRDRKRVDRMAELFGENSFDVIGSDHAPFTREEKLRAGNNVWKSVDGLYGLELTLPLLLKMVEEGKASYESIVKAFSENTAKIFGLKGKGRIEPGRDGDLLLVRRLKHPRKLDINLLYCKCRDCAVIYDGILFRHELAMTILGGRIVYREGQVRLNKGSSNIIHIGRMEVLC